MPTKSYDHFRDFPESDWRWPSFSPAEIASRGDGTLKLNSEAMDKLQTLQPPWQADDRALRLSQPGP